MTYITPTQAKQILEHPQTLHLFATNKPKDLFNTLCLQKLNNENNTVLAIIRPSYTSSGQRGGRVTSAHFKHDNQIPAVNYFCRGAKVKIAGSNIILPEIGLYNSSMGQFNIKSFGHFSFKPFLHFFAC
jgi:hypothetical protein